MRYEYGSPPAERSFTVNDIADAFEEWDWNIKG